MKKTIVFLLVILCAITAAAQKASKSEAKAQQYAEKYERTGSDLTIAFVAENISMSRQQIFEKFNRLLVQQFKIDESDIEDRNPLSGTVKASVINKLFNSGSSVIKARFDIKLAAKEGKARISIRLKDYRHYRNKDVIGEEEIVSRPPFQSIDFNDEKSRKATQLYCDTFLELDKQIEDMLQMFKDYWANGGK